jgi:hypothetical protein
MNFGRQTPRRAPDILDLVKMRTREAQAIQYQLAPQFDGLFKRRRSN